jgi:flagellar assembly protein FliH
MSSKVIRSTDSPAPQSIVWRKVAAGGSDLGPLASPAAGGGFNVPDAGRLREQSDRLAAETEAREIKARQQGYQEGEAAGAQKAAHQYQQAMQRATHSVQETLAARLRMRQQMEQDLVHLAIEVARRILHRELSVDPQALAGIVHAAISRTEARDLLRVRVAAPDKTIVESCLASMNLPERVEVAADPGLERGSLILETTRGAVDSSVETQLQEIDRGLADLVRRQAS